MTTPASILPDVIDALVDTFSSALPVPVFDGPLIVRPSDPLFVMVGATELPGWGDDGEVAQGDSNRSDMGNGEFRDEHGFVTCAAFGWSGTTEDTSSLRRSVRDLLNACEQAILANPTLGVLMDGYFADFGSVQLLQRQNSSGCIVRFTFSVTYSTLLVP